MTSWCFNLIVYFQDVGRNGYEISGSNEKEDKGAEEWWMRDRKVEGNG